MFCASFDAQEHSDIWDDEFIYSLSMHACTPAHAEYS
jgi:hypothetical protein